MRQFRWELSTRDVSCEYVCKEEDGGGVWEEEGERELREGIEVRDEGEWERGREGL